MNTDDFLDPMHILTDLDALERAMTRFGQGKSDNERRQLREEIVQAAVFCAGMSQLWKRGVRFLPGEQLGADAVLAIDYGDHEELGLLQLKQFAPRSTVELQGLIDKAAAKRYNDPERLYLALAVNRSGELDLGALKTDALKDHFVEAWAFGRLDGDRTKWFFSGDLLDNPGMWYLTIEDKLPM